MPDYHLGEVESRFANLIWEQEPLSSRHLAELAAEKLSWKRTTTYTVLKRLCDRGLFQNREGVVTSLVSREEFYTKRSQQFVADTFQGSLPAFLAAFGNGKKLSNGELDELQKIIDKMRR